MKKLLVLLGLLANLSAFASDKGILQERLEKIDGFYAQFTQEVKTASNEHIQDGKGELWIARPHYFNWTMNEPDETSIISDGKTLWVYTPEVEQVSILNLNKAVDNGVLSLIADNKNPIWNSYQITRNQNTFNLLAKNGSSQHYEITILPNGILTNFTIIESDGQRSVYTLSNQKLGKIDKNKFTFTPPKGVSIDDQR